MRKKPVKSTQHLANLPFFGAKSGPASLGEIRIRDAQDVFGIDRRPGEIFDVQFKMSNSENPFQKGFLAIASPEYYDDENLRRALVDEYGNRAQSMRWSRYNKIVGVKGRKNEEHITALDFKIMTLDS